MDAKMWATDRNVLAGQMKEKRERQCLTQERAAKDARINYHSYVRAEQGQMGHEIRAKVIRWLKRTKNWRSKP